MEALKKARYEEKYTIGLDVATSKFKVKGNDTYDLDFKYDDNKIFSETVDELHQSLAADYLIVTYMYPFDEND